ncbi:MAG: N-acetylmuramoyl-L-alanine amidase, partial [Clostridia bacterium]|nr:N-acetylmuramoyl-L-alanine amidase [Clostridia bacterium]
MKHVRGAGCLILLLTLLTTTLLSACGSLKGAVGETAGAAQVTRYYTYGMFFQLEGFLEEPGEVASAALVLRSGSGEDGTLYRAEVPVSLSKKQGRLRFRSAEKIDEGLCLDTLPTGTCAALLETRDREGTPRYWTLEDETGSDKKPAEPAIEYYTLSHGRGHRKVTTEFRTLGERNTLVFQVRRSRLPADVYDIVIDPGHGGKDPGAQSGGYSERDIVLEEAKAIRTALERAGYKVLLTRDGSEDPEVNMAYTLYDKDGRVNRACASKAKLSLSIHLNYSPNKSQNGVQVYRSRKAGDAFARAIAGGLVDGTGLSYSTMAGKTVPGVYTRTFSTADLREERAKAKAKGFSFYEAT